MNANFLNKFSIALAFILTACNTTTATAPPSAPPPTTPANITAPPAPNATTAPIVAPPSNAASSGSAVTPVSPTETNTAQSAGELTIVGDRVQQIGRGTLKQVQISPNGKILAAATSLGVQLYDAQTLALQRVFTASVGTLAVAFSPDNASIAVNDTEDTISIYNVSSGARTRSLSIGNDPVTTLSFLNDPNKLIVIQAGGKTDIWDLTTGKASGKTFTITRGEELGLLLRAVFSADGKQMYVNSADNTLQAWDVERGSQYRVLKGHDAPSTSLAISPDSKLLASASDDHTVRIWDAQTGTALKTLKSHATTLEAVAFSRDGKLLASGDTNHIIKLWDVGSGALMRTITDTRFIKSLSFSVDASQLIVANANAISLFDVKTGKLIRASDGFLEVPGNLAFSKDGKLLAYSDESVMVVWRNWGSKTLQKSVLRGHSKPIIAASISPDAQWLAALAVDGEGLLWNLSSLDKLPVPISGFTSGILGLSFSPDSSQLLIASLDEVQFWDVKTQKLARKFTQPNQQVSAIAFSPIAAHMVSAIDNTKVQIMDINSQKLLRELSGIAEPIYSLVYSADGLRVAAGSELGGVVVWNETSGDMITKIPGSGKTVLSIAFSPDGSLIATGETEGTIKLWQMPTGKLLRELNGHINDIVEVRFSPDSKQLASASADGTVRFWDVR